MPIAGVIIGAISLAAQLGQGITTGVQNKKSREQALDLAKVQRSDILAQNEFTNRIGKKNLALSAKAIQHDRKMADLSNTLRMDTAKQEQDVANLGTMRAATNIGIGEKAAAMGRNFNMIDRIGGGV